MKKNDWLLIASIIFIALVFAGVHQLAGKSGGQVVVKADGVIYGKWPLSEDRTIDINGTNQLLIENGKARMAAATCPDRLCVHQRAIDQDGESIICLPNRVIVTVESDTKSDIDAITN